MLDSGYDFLGNLCLSIFTATGMSVGFSLRSFFLQSMINSLTTSNITVLKKIKDQKAEVMGVFKKNNGATAVIDDNGKVRMSIFPVDLESKSWRLR